MAKTRNGTIYDASTSAATFIRDARADLREASRAPSIADRREWLDSAARMLDHAKRGSITSAQRAQIAALEAKIAKLRGTTTLGTGSVKPALRKAGARIAKGARSAYGRAKRALGLRNGKRISAGIRNKAFWGD
jgi:hypothetical protein